MKYENNTKKSASVYVNEAGKSIDGRPKRIGIGAKIICVVAAFLLWLYVSGDQTFQKTFENIPVTIEDEESIIAEGLEAISKSDAVATVTVTGKRSQINNLDMSDLRPVVSLKGISSSQQYSLPVKVETPPGVSIASIYPESVNVYIDSVMLNTVPVSAEIVSGGVKNIQLSDIEVTLDAEEITVQGPTAIVNRIKSAVAEIDLGGIISSSVDILTNIKLLDENGEAVESEYVSITPGTVNAHIPVFSSKSMRIVPDFDGAEVSDYRYEINPSAVLVQSEDANLLERISEISTQPITVGEETVGTYRCGLVLPDGISLVSEIENVEVKVSSYLEKTVEATNIAFANLDEKLQVESSQKKLNVTFIGSSESLSKIEESGVIAVADLSKYTEKGEYSVDVIIKSLSAEEIHIKEEPKIKITLGDSLNETENR